MLKRNTIHIGYKFTLLLFVLALASGLLVWLSEFVRIDRSLSVILWHLLLGSIALVGTSLFIFQHIRQASQHVKHYYRASFGIWATLGLFLVFVSGIVLYLLRDRTLPIVQWMHSVSVFGIFFFTFIHIQRWQKRVKRKPTKPSGQLVYVLGSSVLVVSSLFAFLGFSELQEEAVYIKIEADEVAPSPVKTDSETYFTDSQLAQSETCGTIQCHPDIMEQWNESAHHLSSFNNPFYAKSIEVLLEKGKHTEMRWCSSCHDPLPLMTGKLREAKNHDFTKGTFQAGITCLSCHAIDRIQNDTGNGNYVMQTPADFNYVGKNSDSILRATMILAHPKPHAQQMRSDQLASAEFCASCHKVAILPEVNGYRWKRGQNQYDSWHQSGISGNSIRTFYLPKESKDCISCHMPKVRSNDRGGENGWVRSHRFASANTALSYLFDHKNQLEATQKNLKDTIATVDIITVKINGRSYGPNDVVPRMQSNDKVQLEIVVANTGVGHQLPAGTNDTNEWWLQVRAADKNKQIVLASGELNIYQAVDSTAHFFHSLLIDKNGNRIHKRNVDDIYTTVYSTTIGPGNAQVIRYEFTVPVGNTIQQISASLLQRKFNQFYTHFTFENQDDPLYRTPKNIDNFPITTVCETKRETEKLYVQHQPEWKRWNNYGIGLLHQDEYTTALQAFAKVEDFPEKETYAKINQARVNIRQGYISKAYETLWSLIETDSDNVQARFFAAECLYRQGNYNEAIVLYNEVVEDYPNDLVLLMQLAKTYYRLDQPRESIHWVKKALAINPEYLEAIYQMMLNYAALGESKEQMFWKEKYLYYKPNEDEKTVQGQYIATHPEANREFLKVHLHQLHTVITGNTL